MPGLYLAAIVVSAAGVATIDARWRLAFWRAPRRAATAVAVGTAFFLAWDAVGIATGVFVKGDSAMFVGLDLAPQLPLEEPLFLAFLSYLALVTWAGAGRLPERRARTDAAAPQPRTEDAP